MLHTKREFETLIQADEPSPQFRSIWRDLAGLSFEQGYLDVQGTRVRYLRSGPQDAPKLIMLPGTAGHTETFAPNMGALGQAFDCWAIDIPGCGYSDKTGSNFDAIHTAGFVKAMAKTLGAAQIDLLGCSGGAWASLQAAHLYPDLVRRMILVSPAGGPLPVESDPWYALWYKRDLVGAAAKVRLEVAKNPTWDAVEEILTHLMPDRRRLPDDMIAARLDANRQPGAAEVVDKVNWWFDYDQRIANTLTREQLRAIKCPVLGVAESNDANMAMVRALLETLPKGRLVRVEGVGHWPHYEAPEQFNALALNFLTADDH